MREPESFDAFYARTVGGVTSSIHEIANGDPQADHAIREAYARAYQQWYEVSGYRDAEAWVLDAAREAFERRQAQAAPEPGLSPELSPRDSGSWPGLFRPRKQADLASTVAAPHLGSEAAGAVPGVPASAQLPPAGGPPPMLADMARPGVGTEPGGPPPADRGGPGAGGHRPNWTGPRGGTRALIAVCVVAAVAAASAVYFALGSSAGPGNNHTNGNGPHHTRAVKPTAHMLKATQVGSRADIPWTLVGQGWTLAEVSTAAPGAAASSGGGATYLVDPIGGRYLIHTWSAGAAPSLVAWSGDGLRAVFSSASSGSGGYLVLTMKTDQVTPLNLPSDVVVAGFTRPAGLNLLAVKEGPARFQLERYDLLGNFSATLATMPRVAGVHWVGGCGSGCAALSSPDGQLAVWGALGTEMQLVRNTGGIVRRLHVPGSGHPPHCTPISWWNDATVLASCSSGGAQSVATQLWLVPTDGSTGVALTTASGSPSGIGIDTGAWQASGQQYITQTTGAQCPSAPSGPGGLQILRLSGSGGPLPVAVTNSSGNHNTIVATDGSRLLVVAQMSCPGTNALMWFNPTSDVPQMLISAPTNQIGVVAAVPWGSGTAVAGN